MKSKRISIVIVPDIEKVKRLSIPKWLPKTILGFLACLILAISLLIINIHSSYKVLNAKYNEQKEEISLLEKENTNKDEEISNLKSSTETFREKTEEVEEKLEEIDKLQKQLEKMAGVKAPSRGRGIHERADLKDSKPESEMAGLNQVLNDKEKEVQDFIVDVEKKFDDLEKVPDLKPVNGRLTSRFGYRQNPFGQNMQFHQGLDIANTSGTIIEAAGKGEIVFSDHKSGYGKTIIIDHGNNYKTLYAHNSKLLVNVGDIVEKGQPISEMGSTGRSTGSHLHFEIHKNDNPIDPFNLLK